MLSEPGVFKCSIFLSLGLFASSSIRSTCGHLKVLLNLWNLIYLFIQLFCSVLSLSIVYSKILFLLCPVVDLSLSTPHQPEGKLFFHHFGMFFFFLLLDLIPISLNLLPIPFDLFLSMVLSDLSTAIFLSFFFSRFLYVLPSLAVLLVTASLLVRPFSCHITFWISIQISLEEAFLSFSSFILV